MHGKDNNDNQTKTDNSIGSRNERSRSDKERMRGRKRGRERERIPTKKPRLKIHYDNVIFDAMLVNCSNYCFLLTCTAWTSAGYHLSFLQFICLYTSYVFIAAKHPNESFSHTYYGTFNNCSSFENLRFIIRVDCVQLCTLFACFIAYDCLIWHNVLFSPINIII